MDVVHIASDNDIGNLRMDVFQDKVAADGACNGLLEDVCRRDVAARSPLNSGLYKLEECSEFLISYENKRTEVPRMEEKGEPDGKMLSG